MILTNPEGRKESDETIIQTDEDGAIHTLFIYLYPRLVFVLLDDQTQHWEPTAAF